MGNFFSTLGLRYKFIIINTCVVIAVMSIIGWLAVEWEKKVFYAEVERQGRLLGKTLIIPIIDDLVYEKLGLADARELLDIYIRKIYSQEDVDLIYIAVLDGKGKVISHTNASERGKTYADPLTAKARTTDATLVERVRGPDHAALDFGVPLSIAYTRWGTLRFAISLAKAEQEIRETLITIALLTIGFLVGGFVVILLLSKRFISPITRLATIMDQVRGDYLNLKLDVKGHDEIAMLGERFNGLIERIRQANEEVKKTQEKLVQSEKLASVGILAAGVAHEINNPLGGIFNCLQMLQRPGDNPELRKKYLDLVREGLEKIESTVNKLLWMSRKGERMPVGVGVRETVESVRAFLEYKMRERKIFFRNQVSEDAWVSLDAHDSHQLFLNLFINSIDAMKEGGVLEVRGYRDDSIVKIEVGDSGCGIEAENLGRIFEPFFTTKPTGEGTGLGLWLTYEIIRSYNGAVTVESQVYKGTTFRITLPLHDPQ